MTGACSIEDGRAVVVDGYVRVSQVAGRDQALAQRSTLTAGVPCPLTIRPAETDHTYVGDAPGAPPATPTMKVTAAP